jgi:hypothetical protein
MTEILEEDLKSKNSHKSKPSFDSVQEISSKNRYNLSFSLIIINIFTFILGIYILYNNNYYLNPDYKFSNHISLYVFIIMYSSGMLSALIISFLFSLIAKLIFQFINNNNSPDKPKLDLINSENEHTRLSIFVLNNKQNEIALIPFTFSYFIIFTIAIYFIALPYTFILLIKLFQNDFLCKVFSFFLLYLFLIINLFAGLIMVLVLFYIVFVKKRGNVRKQDFNIDNSNLDNIKNEIRNAMK